MNKNVISKFPISKKLDQEASVDKIRQLYADLEDWMMSTEVEGIIKQEAIDCLQDALWKIEEALDILE